MSGGPHSRVEARPGRRRFRATLEALAFWGLLAAIGATYFQPVLSAGPPLVSRTPTGYYGALTDAFLSGQLSLKVAVDPRILALKNPYTDHPEIPRPHDVSFHRGKLYLYFGAAPAVLLFMPWRLVTGTWLSEDAATALFCLAGVAVAASLLRRVRDRCFPGCGEGWILLGTALLGWGSPVFYLTQEETFYVVPISGAFFCLMVAAFAVWRALDAAQLGPRSVWIAGASLAYGMAISCRPNYVFGLPILGVPLGYLLAVAPRGSGFRGRWWVAAAAGVPAALVGAAIAAYNYLRFGNPFEIGARYAFMGGRADMRQASLLETGHFWGYVGDYLFAPAPYARYYPFFLVSGPFGAAAYLPVIALGPVLILALLVGRRPRPFGPILVLALLLLGAAAGNLASLGFLYFFGAERYMADFAPSALLLGAIGACWAVGAVPPDGWRRPVLAALLLGLCGFSLVNGGLAAVQSTKSTALAKALGRGLDYPAFWIERAAGTGQGPIVLQFEAPAQRLLRREPLLSTGVPGHADIVYVEYLEGERARIGYFHLGLGGPVSDAFALSGGRHRVTVAMGSLYPPKEHPAFSGYAPGSVDACKRRLAIDLDGTALLDSPTVSYFSTPGLVHVGRNPFARDVSAPALSGRIDVVGRLGMPPRAEEARKGPAPGPIRLKVRFPEGRSGVSEPLVSTGHPGSGDIFFVSYLSGGRIRFGHEDKGSVVLTEPVAVDLTKDHEIDLGLGSLYPPGWRDPNLSDADMQWTRNRLSVGLDGAPLFNGPRPFQPSEPDEVVFALNTIGASTATEAFSGTLRSVEAIDPATLRSRKTRALWGPLDAWVTFPDHSDGRREPLLASGRSGAGDCIYIVYGSEGRQRIGFDHWGYGGPISGVIRADPSQAHHLEISISSLYPPADDPEWAAHPGANQAALKGAVRVSLDGVDVLNEKLPTFEARPDQVTPWANDIGISSCAETFTGEVKKAARAGW